MQSKQKNMNEFKKTIQQKCKTDVNVSMMIKYTIALLFITFCYSTVGKTVGKSTAENTVDKSAASASIDYNVVLFYEIKKLKKAIRKLQTEIGELSGSLHSHDPSSPDASGTSGGGSGGA